MNPEARSAMTNIETSPMNYIEPLRLQWAKNLWALRWWLMREYLAYLLVFA